MTEVQLKEKARELYHITKFLHVHRVLQNAALRPSLTGAQLQEVIYYYNKHTIDDDYEIVTYIHSITGTIHICFKHELPHYAVLLPKRAKIY